MIWNVNSKKCYVYEFDAQRLLISITESVAVKFLNVKNVVFLVMSKSRAVWVIKRASCVKLPLPPE